MTFLPIVARELRVVSRRKMTFWIRCGAAMVGMVFLLPTLGLLEVGGGRQGAGGGVFWFMAWCGAIGCVMAGAFLGADCIAEERREGTLGFLFLTDLRTYDVVLGKFVGASLNAFYGLLAMFPILAITVLAGGVTGSEFWRASLALLNMLFFSTALAVLISSRIKSDTRPTAVTLGLLVVIWIGGGVAFELATTLAKARLAEGLLWLSMASPGQAFSLASAASYLYRHADFWRALAISHALGWIFLTLSCWRLDTSLAEQERTRYRRRRFRSREELEESPIAWLVDDSRAVRVAVWVIAGVGVALVIFANIIKEAGAAIFWMYVFFFLLKLILAGCACRFFAESRRNGALELLRTTPMGGNQMISGQWAALRRIFAVPYAALVVVDLVNGLNVTIRPSVAGGDGGFMVALVIYEAVIHVLDFFTVASCGMWIALACKNPSRAVWLTTVFLVLIPTVVYCFPNILIDPILLAIASDKVRQHLTNYLGVGATNAATSGRWSEATPQSGKLST